MFRPVIESRSFLLLFLFQLEIIFLIGIDFKLSSLITQWGNYSGDFKITFSKTISVGLDSDKVFRECKESMFADSQVLPGNYVLKPEVQAPFLRAPQSGGNLEI